ncbi:MAG TPA: SoxR reducing system RseC family protein [Bacteroidales bacterium]|jgi:sigma-E factor negative regulatory protein RseC|nr:SoxR reducing system RseC family protein [Bacteroidales bacterium]
MIDKNVTEINHEGTVTKNNGDTVTVIISSSSACSGCHAKGSCSMSGTEEKLIEINGKYNVSPGDTVNVVMNQSMGFRALVFGYVLPFFAVIITLMVLVSAGFSELVSGLISLAVLGPYYLSLYIFRKSLDKKFIFSLKTLI